MSHFNSGSLLVGLIVPFVAVVGGVALLGRSGLLVAGIPIVYFWVFLWFVLTSVCLAASWCLFDRKEFVDDRTFEESRDGEGES